MTDKDRQVDRITNSDMQKSYRIGFLHGQVQAIRDYAVWKDGQQFVGVMQKPLNEVVIPLIQEATKINDTLHFNVELSK